MNPASPLRSPLARVGDSQVRRRIPKILKDLGDVPGFIHGASWPGVKRKIKRAKRSKRPAPPSPQLEDLHQVSPEPSYGYIEESSPSPNQSFASLSAGSQSPSLLELSSDGSVPTVFPPSGPPLVMNADEMQVLENLLAPHQLAQTTARLADPSYEANSLENWPVHYHNPAAAQHWAPASTYPGNTFHDSRAAFAPHPYHSSYAGFGADDNPDQYIPLSGTAGANHGHQAGGIPTYTSLSSPAFDWTPFNRMGGCY